MTSFTRIDALITRLEGAMQASDDDEIRWSGPASEAAITAVERALGASIHGSFRDLMLRAGGGGLDTFAISSIPATEPLGGLGAVHGHTLHYRQDWWTTSLPSHLIVIQRSLDDNESRTIFQRLARGRTGVTPDRYRQQYNEDDAVGWQCIDRHLETIHGT